MLILTSAGMANAVVYDMDTKLETSPTWSDDVTINSGVAVTLGENVLPGQTASVTVDILGSLTLNSTRTGNHDANNSFTTASGKAIAFTGNGTFIKTGTGRIAASSGSYTNGADNPGTLPSQGGEYYSVKFAMGSGGLIDIQQGALVNGGYYYQDWTENLADMQIASGAYLDVWDGDNIYVDALVGAGNVTNGTGTGRCVVNVGMDNSTWFDAEGKAITPVFSGDFASGKNISFQKNGTGTQILSGNFLSTGNFKVEGGTLQVGDGTNGSIGTGATVSVASGTTLVYNSTKNSELTKAVGGTGTINIQKGGLYLANKENTFTGAYHVGADGVLGVSKNTFFDTANLTTDVGATFALNVNNTDTDAFTATQFNNFRSAGTLGDGVTVGFYTVTGTTTTVDLSGDMLATNVNAPKYGTGTLIFTGENTTFTSNIAVNEGVLALGNGTTAGKVDGATVTLASGTQFVIDNGADSTTVLKNYVTGAGEMVIASGTVQVTKDSPSYANITLGSWGTGKTHFAVPKVTIKDGARLAMADEVVPAFSNPDGSAINATINIEAGGVMELNNKDSAVSHYYDNSAFFQSSVTITGAGTLEKTGAGGMALLCREGNSAVIKIRQDAGGWIDIKEGTLASGGWSSNIQWRNDDEGWQNLGSLNIAKGATMDLWDGNYITVDSLTGEGTFKKGGIVVGVGNNVNSEKYGVADNTATFSGVLEDGGKTTFITKRGTGTQILSGENTYTGNTNVDAGKLQFGNGGATGKIGSTGTAYIARGAELAFNTTGENTINAINPSSIGTLSSSNTGKVTVNSTIGKYEGTVALNHDGAVVQFATAADAEEFFVGKVTGTGTLQLAMSENATVNLSSATIADTATVSGNGGKFIVRQDFAGTVSATDNMTMNLTQNYNQNPWDMTFYVGDSSLNGRVAPTTDASMIKETIKYDAVYNMDQVANNSSGTEVAKFMTKNYAAMSYTNHVEVLEDITIDLNGCFDDTQGVWVMECDADGNPIEGATWRELQGYGTNCATHEVKEVTLAKGHYIFDVRVADQSGNRYATGSVKDKDGNSLGVGLRLNGANTYSAFDIDTETGYMGLASGQMVTGTAKDDFTFSGKLDVAEGKTLTFDNPYSNAKSYDIDTTVTGKGTLALTNSGNANAEFDVNIDTEGSLDIADAMNVTLAGNIDGDLSMGDNVVLNFELATTATSPVLTVGGDVVLGSDGIMNVFLTGDAPQDGELLDLVLIQAGEEGQITFDPIETNFFVEDPNLRFSMDILNNAIHLTLGNSNSLPEPGTWGLMLVGLLGVGYITRQKRG
ncbi:MAG: autotransporter-associated beta strand repeat-containing protein [Planctomycetia bacterium]|nr:autotransporter-associated beta strand repeat-containing protein [Planctomycetia bacterium]